MHDICQTLSSVQRKGTKVITLKTAHKRLPLVALDAQNTQVANKQH